MAAVLPTNTNSNNTNIDPNSVRLRSEGCWTGWLCDMEVMKNITRKITPENYLESYPRSRAIGLNTWLFRFGLYSNGMFLELDRYGSVLAKDLIKHSQNPRGYLVRIDGARNGEKLRVNSIIELAKGPEIIDPDFSRISQQQLRGEFCKMGL
jgi:hypothetical protein